MRVVGVRVMGVMAVANLVAVMVAAARVVLVVRVAAERAVEAMVAEAMEWG